MQTREDIPMDDVESFDAARDKILLDDTQNESDSEEEDFGASNREVLPFDSDHDDEDEVDESEAREHLDGVNEEDSQDEYDDDDDERYRTMHIPEEIGTAAQRRAPRDDAHGSDVDSEEESDEDSGWGANKRAYYSGNTAEDLESDSDIDEEKAHELETNEAIRLQRLSRAGMGDEEFGLENIDAEEAQINSNEQSAAARAKRKRDLDDTSTESLAPMHATPEELLSKLEGRAPIVLALIDEFGTILKQLPEAQAYVNQVSDRGERQVAEIAHLYYQTLSSYAMLLAFFFQLASVPAMASQCERLLQHPVMERLSQFKKALVEMKALGLFDPEDPPSDQDSRELAGIMGPPTEEDIEYEQLGDLEPGEVEGLIADEKENQHAYKAPKPAGPAPMKRSRTKPKQHNSTDAPPTAPPPLAAVASVAAGPIRASKRAAVEKLDDADAYGEPVQMRATDAQEKAQRKRATLFHADGGGDPSQSLKQNKLEGDTDIPYRDRRRSREAVAAAKSNKLAKMKPQPEGIELNETEWGESDWRDRNAVMGSGTSTSASQEDGDDAAAYYDLISSNKRTKKAVEKEEHDRRRLEERIYDDDTVAPGEHRVIDRNIEKNKGLTPNRSKNIRNPRLKRRMKFDRANKRLSSTRAVYKGGQSALQGGYQGEKSGISTNLVKSRKLGS